MQQLAGHHVAWVRVLLLIVAATLVLVVGAGAAYAQIGVHTDDLGDEIAATIKDAGDGVSPTVAGKAVKDVTGGVGSVVKDATHGTGSVVKDATHGTGDALREVTGRAGPALKEVTGPAGGAVNDASGLLDKSVAGVTPRPQHQPRPTVERGRVDGNSIAVSERVSEHPTSIRKGAGNDLPAVVQAPGSVLGDSVGSPGDASTGSIDFELPFGLGTLPLTGIELALIALLGLATALVGWAVVRFTAEASVKGALEA